MLLEHPQSQNDGWGKPSSTSCGDFDGVVYQYQADELMRNRWYLRGGRTLLFVTYFCSKKGQAEEYFEAVRDLSTLRLERMH